FPEHARYRVHAGQSYIVSGNGTPYFTVAREVDGKCKLDETRHPLRSQRISIHAPHCQTVPDGDDRACNRGTDPATKMPVPTHTNDALKVSLTAEGVLGNPCLYEALSCDDTASGPHVKA